MIRKILRGRVRIILLWTAIAAVDAARQFAGFVARMDDALASTG